jgi:hypothetical protein
MIRKINFSTPNRQAANETQRVEEIVAAFARTQKKEFNLIADERVMRSAAKREPTVQANDRTLARSG